MRWQGLGGSSNIEDRRGRSGMPIGGKAGIVVVLIVMIAGFYGVDLTPLLGGGQGVISSSQPYQGTPEEQQMADFTSVALKTTEDTWDNLFRQMGQNYVPPKLVLYSGVTQTTCGYGQSAMGPFYCPGDQTVYIDLSFYHDMKTRLGGGGDFAQGYVIAHEVGHHVQHLLGVDQQVRSLQQRASQSQANQLSVMVELQADCFAGVWGHYMEEEGILDPGDLESALKTAQAIGDDRLQMQNSGRVVPDSFTHGTSEQRYTWFKRGYDAGEPAVCNTFSGIGF